MCPCFWHDFAKLPLLAFQRSIVSWVHGELGQHAARIAEQERKREPEVSPRHRLGRELHAVLLLINRTATRMFVVSDIAILFDDCTCNTWAHWAIYFTYFSGRLCHGCMGSLGNMQQEMRNRNPNTNQKCHDATGWDRSCMRFYFWSTELQHGCLS